MLTLQVRRSRPELRAYVRIFVQRKIDLTSPLMVEPTTAQLEQILAFEFGTPSEMRWPDGGLQKVDTISVAGAQTQFACHMQLRGGVESFGIFFLPTAFMHLFGIPSSEVTNSQGDAEAMVGHSIRALWNQLGETPYFEDRVLIAEEFLMHRAARAKAGSTIVTAAEYMFDHHGAVQIADIAYKCSIGVRQFEREFRRQTGASPKTFARIARFQAALDAKVAAPQRTWLDIAHSFGYYDQMHMIHDFEILGRNCPSQLIAQIGDSRPPAMARAEDDSATATHLLTGSD
ncbi:MAG TPA: AraC family transcriptional regulator [Acidobacteriaceae bacterium]